MLIVTLLLIVDLSRPERFWHMVLMSERLMPILKPWSPMSLGSYLVMIFSLFCFISFVDALVDYGKVRIAGWRADRTLHGGPYGTAWTVAGALFGLAVAVYAGVLLTVTNIPGWAQAPLIPAVYAATSVVTGVAFLVLVQALRNRVDADIVALAHANTWLIAWWLLVMAVFLVFLIMSVDGAARYFLASGWPTLALIGAVVLGGLAPLALRARRGQAALALSASLALLGGLLLRAGIVMGPQEWIH
jgi:formate-dependent nitrite reductase membrane component NrfD